MFNNKQNTNESASTYKKYDRVSCNENNQAGEVWYLMWEQKRMMEERRCKGKWKVEIKWTQQVPKILSVFTQRRQLSPCNKTDITTCNY